MAGPRYRFEELVRDWAVQSSRAWCGEPCTFFLGLREEGTVRRIYFCAPGDTFDADHKARMAEAHPRWLLFAAQPEGTYLEWLGIPAGLAERWLLRPLDAAALADLSGLGSRGSWPESWRVIAGPLHGP